MALFRFLKEDCIVHIDGDTGEVYWVLSWFEAIVLTAAWLGGLAALGVLAIRHLA